MNRTQMKPYGRIYSQGKTYLLLNPQPISKDSIWNDGTYMFLVATEIAGYPRATTIVTNNFVLEYDAFMPSIEVYEVAEDKIEHLDVSESDPLFCFDMEDWLDHETAVLDDQEPLTDSFIDIEEGE